jgi:type II secretory pathway pseudopilin PulG
MQPISPSGAAEQPGSPSWAAEQPGSPSWAAEQPGRRSDEAGFTLVEALIAIVVLVFGLVAITNLLIVAASSNSAGNQSSAATAIASEQLEVLKAIPFTDPRLNAGGNLDANVNGYFHDSDPGSGANYDGRMGVEGVGRFRVRWLIVQIAGDNQTRFIRVRAEPVGGLMRARARAEFATFRSCTSTTIGCPTP